MNLYNNLRSDLTMILTNDEAIYYYKLWIPLLDYVNRTKRLIPYLYGMTSPQGLPLSDVNVITSALWENPHIIENYINDNSNSFSSDDLSILKSWMNNNIHDKFIVDRHLKKGSVLISMQTEEVYIVKGIYSSWKEMLDKFPMPQIVEATLIPFKDTIIHDGIVIPYGITLGKNVSEHSKTIYMNAKNNNSIHYSF